MIGVLGIDPFGSGPQNRALLNELIKAGFRKSELKHHVEIPEGGEFWYLLFGSPALKEFVGPDLRMADVRGEILCCDWNPDALLIPNYAPGYIYHNPNLKDLWLDTIRDAKLILDLDLKGVLA